MVMILKTEKIWFRDYEKSWSTVPTCLYLYSDIFYVDKDTEDIGMSKIKETSCRRIGIRRYVMNDLMIYETNNLIIFDENF